MPLSRPRVQRRGPAHSRRLASPGRWGEIYLRVFASSLLALLLAGASGRALAGPGELPEGEQVARRINALSRPSQASRIARLELVDREGRVRERRLRSFWKLEPESRRLLIFALSPPEMKHEAFLAYDYFDSARDDEQWIYKPTRKRAQRIASPRRGDSFLGSDFTLEDLKKEDRVEVGEYTWKTLGEGTLDGQRILLVEQVPATQRLVTELGYGRILNYVDSKLWMRRRIEFFDPRLALVKTFDIGEIEQIEGYWTARRIEAIHHGSGQRSVLRFDEIDYRSPLDDTLFSPRTMEEERWERLGPARPPE
jgi:hypothetical protein